MTARFDVDVITNWSPSIQSTQQFVAAIQAELGKLRGLGVGQQAAQIQGAQRALVGSDPTTVGGRLGSLATAGQITPAEAAQLKASLLRPFQEALTQLSRGTGPELVQAIGKRGRLASTTAREENLFGSFGSSTEKLSDLTDLFAQPNTRQLLQERVGTRDALQGLFAAQQQIATINAAGDLKAQSRDPSTGRFGPTVPVYDQTLGQAAAARTAQAAAIKRITEQELTANATYIADTAATNVAQKERARAINNATTAIIRQRTAEGAPGYASGSVFQRLQASIAARQGGAPRQPEDFQNLGQFVSSRALTTVGFAASGLGVYGAVQGIKGLIDQSEQLQVELSQVRQEFVALGDGSQFAGFRSAILEISRDTGATGSEVAQVALQMKGAFGDTQVAIQATLDTIKVMRVTGIDAGTAVNDLTAITKTFGGSVTDVSDLALVMQDRFGVMAKETLAGLGTLAPVAKEVGLSLQETAGLIASVAQVSARPASSIAEGFNRILPALQKQAITIVGLYQSIPALASKAPQIGNDVALGNYGQVLVELIRDSDKFTDSQRNQIIELVGGRREAQALVDAFQNSDKVIQAMEGHLDTAGRTQKSFAAVQATVTQQLERLKQAFEQIGEALLRAGLTNGLKDVGTVLGGLLVLVGDIVRAFASVNDATHGWAGRALELAIALRAVSAAIAVIRGIGLVSGVLGATEAAVPALVGSAANPIGATAGVRAAGLVGGAEAAGTGGATGLLAKLFGSGAGIGGTAVTGAGLGVTAALAAGVAYYAWKSEADAHAKAITERLQKDDNDQLQKAAAAHAGFWTSVHDYLTGNPTPDEAAAAVLRGRQFSQATPTNAVPLDTQARAAQQAKLFANLSDKQVGDAIKAGGGLTAGIGHGVGVEATSIQVDYFRKHADVVAKLIAEADKGDKSSAKILAALVGAISSADGPDVMAVAVENYKASTSRKGAQDAITSGTALQTAQEAKDAYGAGLISGASFLDAMAKVLDEYKLVGVAGLSEAQRKEYLAAQQDVAKFLGDNAKKADDFAKQLGELYGTETPQAAVSRDTARAGNRSLDLATRVEAASSLVKDEQAQVAEQLKLATSMAEVDKILSQGVPVDPGAREAIAENELGTLDLQWQAFFNGLQAAAQSLIGGAGAVAEFMVKNNVSSKQAVRSLIATELAELRKLEIQMRRAHIDTSDIDIAIDQLTTANNNLDKIASDYSPAATAKGGTGDQASQQSTAAQAIMDVANRHAEYAKAMANGDPVAIAQAELDKDNSILAELSKQGLKNTPEYQATQTDKLNTQHQLDAASAEIAKARLDLLKAQDSNDPVKLARDTKREADLALATAHGDAARIQAQAQEVAADRGIADAAQAIVEAHYSYLEALAGANGDPIGQSQQTVSALRQKISFLLSQGADPAGAQILLLNGQLLTAIQDVANTQISETEKHVQAQLGMKQISIGQAVAQLRALKGLAKGQDEIDQLNTEIYSLLHQAGADLQFNLPSDINLPTLYEARRLDAGPGPGGYGGGHVDNRTQTFQFFGSDATLEEIKKAVAQAAGTTSSVYGTYARRT